ncbi:patatin family protein [Endozoicomonas sp.]|uniref:patatin-like phospholipase family protein n=1 Tax=Endozoicomonas sp. TaxID=1892382 RepID=UPI0028867498|nr:patatin family protein [Endozoicomonas sp.]
MQSSNNSSPAKRALVVEGGGMRGVFTAGVLDAFLDKRVRSFNGYYGVSSGALNLSSFIAGQRGRNLELYTNLCLNSEFISVLRHIKGGNLFDLDWFFQKINQQNSLNLIRFKNKLSSEYFTVVSTCIETGQPVYNKIDGTTSSNLISDILKASSALPMIYRKPVVVNGQALTDGSLSDPLPILKAVDDGFNQIIVLRTRPVEFRKKTTTGSRIHAWQSRQMPAVAQLIKHQNTIYNQAADTAEAMTLDGNVELIQVAPQKALSSSRGTRQRNHLVSDYHYGYTIGYAVAEQLNTNFTANQF